MLYLRMERSVNIIDAACFAASKHKHQRRKGDDSSYICHPLEVAQILAHADIRDTDVLIAAILHDTVEDTDASLEEITTKFGSKVARYVQEVSDDKTLPKLERKKLQLLHAVSISRGAQLIKLADKIHNCSDLEKTPPKGWTQKDVRGYLVWDAIIVDRIPFHHILHRQFEQIVATELPQSKEERFKILGEYYDGIK